MKEHPILFSEEMVRAILEGRKTQTRRALNPQPNLSPSHDHFDFIADPWHNDAFRGTPAAGYGRRGERKRVLYSMDYVDNPIGEYRPCPYGERGDRLWVREAWNALCSSEAMWWHEVKLPLSEKKAMNWAITNPIRPAFSLVPPRWVSARFMPRFAARIFLEIVNARVEQLQDISEADARAEGVTPSIVGDDLDDIKYRCGFVTLWDSINAKRGLGWDTNPWVWVIEFKAVAP